MARTGNHTPISTSSKESTMTTDLHDQALAAVAAVPANWDGSRRLRAVKLLRDGIKNTTGQAPVMLGPLVEAVDWAMEQPQVDLNQHRVPSEFGWSYRFPNGHEASVVNDPSRPFRFEVLSDDPADAARGRVSPGLTSEQVEAKLYVIAALPAR